MKFKVSLEKIAAYGAGAMVGGGLTWLGWRWLEKRGINPMDIFKKKATEGNRVYFDRNAADAEFDIDNVDNDLEIEGDEEEEEDDEEDDQPVVPVKINREPQKPKPPYLIDYEEFENSEDEGFAHGWMKYYVEDRQITDENGELVEKPWKIIGTDNFDMLSDPNGDLEIYVRNESVGRDYAISKEEGGLADIQR